MSDTLRPTGPDANALRRSAVALLDKLGLVRRTQYIDLIEDALTRAWEVGAEAGWEEEKTNGTDTG